MTKTIYYYEPTDDVVQTAHQDFQLSQSFRWLREKPREKLWSSIIRHGAKAFAFGYTYGIKHVKIVGSEKLKALDQQSCFIYGNHTQPINDVFMPFLLGKARQFYAIAAPANWGIPILGPLLSYGGGLPTGSNLHQTMELLRAIQKVVAQDGHVFIYPEAHVWPAYTEIRPFPLTSFRFPVKTQRPAFSMTTTYQPPRHGKKPRMVVYIDGPFIPDANQSTKAQQQWLHDQIAQAMQKRAQLSTYETIHYQRKKMKS